jgi:hypothetical protein
VVNQKANMELLISSINQIEEFFKDIHVNAGSLSSILKKF